MKNLLPMLLMMLYVSSFVSHAFLLRPALMTRSTSSTTSGSRRCTTSLWRMSSNDSGSSPSSTSSSSDAAEEEAQALLERVKQMRQEIAALEGRSVEQVEQEAQEKKRQEQERHEQREQARQLERQQQKTTTSSRRVVLSVPETHDDQVQQAAEAVQRAFQDGVTRQVVRFALVPEDERLNEDRQWPGGAQQMYRQAAGPLTRNMLRLVGTDKDDFRRPNVTSQDVWEFDGSALVTAEAASGPKHDVQALVLPNTDNKYTDDVVAIDKAMKERLFLLVNPFWRNLDSWGINLLQPKAKENAKKAIFDRGFTETYCLLQISVRGEDCLALKAYPYDWQLYAYLESDDIWNTETIVHLGSTKDEPTPADFGRFLSEREEFKLNKNMRAMQRMMGNKNDE